MIKRLAIYVICDTSGIVDSYIPNMLHALAPHTSDIIVACKRNLPEQEQSKISKSINGQFAYFDENINYVGVVKATMLCVLGWEKIYEYDELLICNDSFYGPLFPLSECFDKMDKADVDFWGITECGETRSGVPRHLQDYFINIKPRLLKSSLFCMLWEEYAINTGKSDFMYTYELAKKGSSYATLIPSAEFVYENTKLNYEYFIHEPIKLIKKYRCPFILKQCFATESDGIGHSGNEEKNNTMNVIAEYSKYDTNLIWDNLLRTCDIHDIRKTLHLNFILPSKVTQGSVQVSKNVKAVVIMHLFYLDIVDEALEYLRNIPCNIDLLVTTSVHQIASKVKEQFKSCEEERSIQIRIAENYGRDVGALLITCRDILMNYDYLCFTHDKGMNPSKYNIMSVKEDESFRYILWENTLASAAYIENIIKIFEDCPRLGLLSTPQPYHGRFFSLLGNEWSCMLKDVKTLASRMGLRNHPVYDKPTFAIGNSYWCRPKAMSALFEHNWSITDFASEPMPLNGTLSHAIERILPYVAQHEGYFSGVVMSERYASIRMIDSERVLTLVFNRLSAGLGGYSYDEFFTNIVPESKNFVNFCMKYQKIYLYGAGSFAEELALHMDMRGISYDGFIITDGQQKPHEKKIKPVYFFSEIDCFCSTVGIVVAVAKKNRHEILSILNEKKAVNIFTF